MNITQCHLCSPGSYCSGTALTGVSGLCSAGFYCAAGSQLGQPIAESFGDECTSGHFCHAGSNTPTPCVAGTFNPDRRSVNVTSCAPCPGGWACETSGLSAPSNPCLAGYFCTSGSSTVSPSVDSNVGGICPPGSYCLDASTSPRSCVAGTFSSVSGASVCSPCPAGFTCTTSGTTAPMPCPAGNYCPSGSISPVPCASGTFISSNDGVTIQSCIICSPGYYCPSSGTAIMLPCPVGYYCAMVT